MPSLKLIFQGSASEQGEGSLYFRVIHNRCVVNVNTHVKILADEWNADEGSIKGERKEKLTPALEQVRLRLERIIALCAQEGADYSVRTIQQRYEDNGSVVGFISFARSVANECEKSGRQSAALHYRQQSAGLKPSSEKVKSHLTRSIQR